MRMSVTPTSGSSRSIASSSSSRSAHVATTSRSRACASTWVTASRARYESSARTTRSAMQVSVCARALADNGARLCVSRDAHPPDRHRKRPGSPASGDDRGDAAVEDSADPTPEERRMTSVVRPEAGEPATAATPRSAAAPSPFTPIAEYAFLSDCHTGALVAPDGSIDWLCVPRFDAPSVFGALVDRQAGQFRLGPFGLNFPAARAYDPGSNTVITSWHVPGGGWAEVRDALTMGPREGEDTITPHTRPPADDDADHMLVRMVTCLEGSVEI